MSSGQHPPSGIPAKCSSENESSWQSNPLGNAAFRPPLGELDTQEESRGSTSPAVHKLLICLYKFVGMGQMEVFDWDSCLALIMSVVYTYKSLFCISGMFTGGRATVQLQDCWSKVGGGEEAPTLCSPPFLLCNWSAICQSLGTHTQIPTWCECMAKCQWGETAEQPGF